MLAMEARLLYRPGKAPRRVFPAASLALVLILAGCSSQGSGRGMPTIATTTQHGYVVSPFAIEQIPVGSSKDQVLIALGSPSTEANYGNDVFYYISQTRRRAADFLPEKVVDQNIVAVYFDNSEQVERIANYTIQDGVVFDSISRTTPTGGADQKFIQQVFSGLISGGS